MEILTACSDLIVLLLLTLLQMISAQDDTTMIFTIEGTSAASIPTATIQSDLIFPLQTMYSSGMRGDASTTATNIKTEGGNTVIDILVGFSHLQKVQVGELGLLTLDYLKSNAWSLTIGGNDQTFLQPVIQRHTNDEGVTKTVNIVTPCSLYTSFDWCGAHGTCVPVIGRPYCGCDAGFCGQFCGGAGDNLDCIGAFIASGDSVNTNKVGTCPASTTSCNANVEGGSSCTNDFDCDDFDFCCPTSSSSLCCMPGVEISDIALMFYQGPCYNYGLLALTFSNNDYTLCTTGWTSSNSEVACRELGFGYGGELNGLFANVNVALSPILKNVDCFGAEAQLSQCNHDGWFSTGGCSASTNVGLFCYDIKDSLTLTLVFQTPNSDVDQTFKENVENAIDNIYTRASIDTVIPQVTSNTDTGSDTLITLVLNFDEPANPHTQTKYAYTLVEAIEDDINRALSSNLPRVGAIKIVLSCADETKSSSSVLLSPITIYANRRCTINNAKNTCVFGSCAISSSGDTYCSCDPGYNGEFCQVSVSYPQTDLRLSVGSTNRKKRAAVEACLWYSGSYEKYYDGFRDAYFWHESGQAYLRQNDATKWELVQVNNDGSELVLLTGNLQSGNPYGSPLLVTSWVDASGSSVAVTLVQYTQTSDLLAYGLDSGDTIIPKADSTGADKLRIKAAIALPSGGLHFQREIATRIFISDFGSVSFEKFHDFAAIPSTIQDISMIFPYLAQQSWTCPGQSIFYHIYRSTNDGDTNMINAINLKVRTQYYSSRELSAFTASYAVVITWYQGREGICDYELTCLADQSNTYQLVLAVSGTYTIGIILYESDAMSGTTDVQRGYINSRSTDTADAIRPENQIRSSIWTGELDPNAGPLFFRVGSNAVEVPECIAWFEETVDLAALPNSQLNNVQACPYTATQANVDLFWNLVSTSFFKSSIPDRLASDPNNEITCYSPFSQKTVSSDGSSYSVLQTCCYDTDNGARVTTSDGQSGFLTLLASSTVSGTLSDRAAYSRCCEDTGVTELSTGDLCPLFYSRRPKNNSLEYSPPFIALSFGDPHFITMDGAAYTFNPWGEFVFLKTNNFEIQARILNNVGGDHKASAFTAFATKDAFGINAYVGLNDDKDGFFIYTGSSSDRCANDRSDFIFNSQTTIYVDNLFLIKDKPGSNKVAIVYPQSEWVIVFTINHGIMSINLQAPPSLPSGSTSGLLGVFDGDSSNDLTTSTGTVLDQSTVTNQDIHSTFGMSWRVTNEAESIMCYKQGKTFSQFYEPSWVPQFDVEFDSEAERQSAEQICESNQFCMFDLSTLGDELVALSTLEKLRSYTENKNILGNKPPEIAPIDDVDIIVGQQMTITIVATDREGSGVTISKTEDSPGTLSGNVFTWTPTSCSPVQIGFSAMDENGAASSVVVPVLRCCKICLNDGDCGFTSAVASTVPTFLVAVCECSPGWEGDICSEDMNGCADDPCADLGTSCTDLTPAQTDNNYGIGYRCTCPTGYKQVQGLCVDLDECTSSTNPHGCDLNADCSNTDGSYECVCRSGWTLDTDAVTCLNVNECSLETSECEHICRDKPGYFECACYNGYTLNSDGKTCLEVTQCSITTGCSQICEVAGTGFSRIEECQCMLGYELLSDGATCTDVNECQRSPVPCDTNSGSCTNSVPGYSCECQSGYKLSTDLRSCEACDPNYWGDKCENYCNCEENVESCDPVTGCTNCFPGWQDYNCRTDINECMSAYCPDKSKCQNTEGSYVCVCNAGYKLNAAGDTCEDLDECKDAVLNSCSQLCINTAGSFECQCSNGYTLQSDKVTCLDDDECSDSPSPCSKAHNCFNLAGSFECSCDSGYQLSAMKICNDINECSDPILSDCSGSCSNNEGSFTCMCGPGYTLGFDKKSCIDIDECSTTVINQIHGCDTFTSTCANTLGSFRCQCNVGYSEEDGDCADINECTNALDNCDQICINSEGGFSCDCNAGFDLQPDGYSCSPTVAATCANACDYECIDLNDGQGPQCVCQSGYMLNADGYACDDVNECSDGSNNCDYQPGCLNVPGSYSCSCGSGYELGQDERSCNDVSECENINTNLCENKDLCVNTPGDFYCGCPTGFTNTSKLLCQDTNECDSNFGRGPCSVFCVNTRGSSYCACPATAELQPDGVICVDINECSAVLHDCSEFANCINTDPGFGCQCMEGYNSTDQGRTCIPMFSSTMPTVVTVITTTRKLPSSPTRTVIQLVSPTNLGYSFWTSTFYRNIFQINAEEALEKLYESSYVPSLQDIAVTSLRQGSQGSTMIEFTVTTVDAMLPAEQVAIANILAEQTFLAVNDTRIIIDKVSTVIVDDNGRTQLLSATDPCALYIAMDACENDGICRQIGTTAECRCASEYTGDYCDSRVSDQNVKSLVVALATMGSVLVILAIMVVSVVIYYRRNRGRRRQRADYDTSSSGSSRTHPSVGSRMHFAPGGGWYSGMWQNPWRKNQFGPMPSTSAGFAAQFREPEEQSPGPSYPWGKTGHLPRFSMADGRLSGRPNYQHTPYYYADHID